MLKGHPKGLLVAFFANMGERFGFYTMMAILSLFLQARFYNILGENAGIVYSIFYASIYVLALVGGIIADRFIGMKKTISMGIVLMAVGYAMLALPAVGIELGGAAGSMTELVVISLGLLIIAFGNGLFKGNLQAVVGNLYEDKKYSHLRDSAFSIFYMGINIGALFAPTVAYQLRTWYLAKNGFSSIDELPKIANKYLAGDMSVQSSLAELSEKASLDGAVTNLQEFASSYVETFSTGYMWAFGFAGLTMLVSLFVFFAFNKHLSPGYSLSKATGAGAAVPEMPAKEVKERLVALFSVFAVVIFFWMSFHQNGLSLTYFARDYTADAAPDTSFWFNIWVLLSMLGTAIGLYMVIKRAAAGKERLIGLAMTAIFGYLSYYTYTNLLPESQRVAPELFQHMNPFFIVALTPIAVGLFSWLNKKGKEPSAPRKIAYGMLIAAAGFVVLLIASLGVASPTEVAAGAPATKLSAYWLINTYFILTIAELFLSPMGISFVSKVAPPKMKGIMQGMWLCATAVGNLLLFVGEIFYYNQPLWMTWGFFIVCCIISAIVMFALLKRVERVAR